MPDSKLTCTPLAQQDVYPVTRLLRSIKFHIGGAQASFKQIREFCEVALNEDSDLFITVAKDEHKQLAGVVLGVRNWRSFWRGIYLKNPLLLPPMGIAAIQRKITKIKRKNNKNKDIDLVQLEKKETSLWHDKNPAYIHILLIVVDMSHRQKKIGQRLYTSFLQHLKRNQIEKVIARIDRSNTPSIILHQKSGWNVYEVSHYAEAVIELKDIELPEQEIRIGDDA